MYAFTKDKETIIQVHGIGHWGIDYLNPQSAGEEVIRASPARAASSARA